MYRLHGVPRRLAEAVARAYGALICLLFPSPCRLCGCALSHAGRIPICGPCLDGLPPAPPGCRQCGKAFADAEDRIDGRCLSCQTSPPPYAAARTVAAYRGSARELIHLMKFRGVRTIAGFWAQRLASLAVTLPQAPELVVPVPLARRRRRQRGFNQSADIGSRLARRLGCAYDASGLRRRRETRSQAGLHMEARRQNVAGAFVAVPRRVAGKRVLLIDDVLTTGATAQAAAAALLRAGALRVDLAVAARADRFDLGTFDAGSTP